MYTVISGHRRLEAVKLLIAENRRVEREIPCMVYAPKNPNEEIIALILLNATSRELTDGEKLRQYSLLKEAFEQEKIEARANGGNYGRVREKIAEVLKVSCGQAAKLETIVKHADESVKKSCCGRQKDDCERLPRNCGENAETGQTCGG